MNEPSTGRSRTVPSTGQSRTVPSMPTIAIKELWTAIGKIAWEKHVLEEQYALALVRIDELTELLKEKDPSQGEG